MARLRGLATLLVMVTMVCTACATGSDDADSQGQVDATLRDELVQMQALDQSVRGGPAAPGADPTEVPDIDQVDAENQARLGEILDEHGWPGWSLVGKQGSTAAWTIVQHADLDPAFQERGLDLLRAAVKADDASPGDLAYLEDRVLVARGEPQIYATQWELNRAGRWVPRTPITDRAHVDERRAEAGLDPLADYLDELDAMSR